MSQYLHGAQCCNAGVIGRFLVHRTQHKQLTKCVCGRHINLDDST